MLDRSGEDKRGYKIQRILPVWSAPVIISWSQPSSVSWCLQASGNLMRNHFPISWALTMCYTHLEMHVSVMSCDLCTQGRHFCPPTLQISKEGTEKPKVTQWWRQGYDLNSGSLILDLMGLTIALLRPYGPTSIPWDFCRSASGCREGDVGESICGLFLWGSSASWVYANDCFHQDIFMGHLASHNFLRNSPPKIDSKFSESDCPMQIHTLHKY